MVYCILTSGRVSETPFGEEGFALSLGKWLTKQNLTTIVIGSKLIGLRVEYLSKHEIVQEKTSDKKNVRTVYPPYVIFMLYRLVFSLLCFIKILSINRKTPITLIHAQDTGYSGLPAIIAGKILKVPTIISSHGIRHRTIQSILTGKLGKILTRLEYGLDMYTLNHADGIIALNPEIKKYYEDVVKKTIEFIPNPIKIKNFRFSLDDRNLIRKELGIEGKTKVISFVGRLSPEKNLLTLLDSFTQVLQEDSLVKLLIVGTGPQESKIREEVIRRNIEKMVIFCGLRRDIPKILSATDVFVLPSYTEGLSGALLEAMSCGRAIVCSDIPANQLLITHKKEGLLINPHDSKDLAGALCILVRDERLRSTLGNNAKIKAEQYDEEHVFPKILRYYDEKQNPSSTTKISN